MRLESLAKKITLAESTELCDINAIIEIYEDIIMTDATWLSTLSARIASTLFQIYENLSHDAKNEICLDDNIKRKLVGIVNNMAASFSMPETGDKALIRFLHILNERKKLFEERDILKDYDKYVNRLDNLAWLFQLELDGELVYPIGDLLSTSILDEFEPDEEHLLYLIASLQLFAALLEIPAEAKKTILEYSKSYNLKILEMLCEQGTLLYGIDKKRNMELNKTIVVRCNNTILVRTTDLSRRELPDYPYLYEHNSKGEYIAKFFTYEVRSSYSTISLDDFFHLASPDECRTVFLKCISDNIYNVFMDDSILYDNGSRRFIGWTNPSVMFDHSIISDVTGELSAKHNNENGFFFTLDRHTRKNWCRSAVLAQNGIDILTLDFIIEFCSTVSQKFLVPASQFIPQALQEWESNRDRGGPAFAQNCVYQHFFAVILAGKYNLSRAVTSYLAFIQANYNSEGDITANTRLIMPYAFHLPFQSHHELYQAMLSKSGISIQDSRCIELIYMPDKKWYEHKQALDICVLDLITLEPVIPTRTKSRYKGLVDIANNTAYVLSDPKDKIITTAFDELTIYLDQLMINMQNRSQYETFPINELKELIVNVGLPKQITSFFWPTSYANSLTREQMMPLLMYKIINHVNHFSISAEKLPLWKDLIFTCHLRETSSRESIFFTSFVENTRAISPDDGCLLISKQSHADKSTLEALLGDGRERDVVDLAFDAQALNNRIIKHEGLYYFKTKDGEQYEIKRIVFLTDNIISGGSTKKMLMFHLNNQKETPESIKRGFLVLDPEKSIYEIVQANNPIIEVHTAFWFSSLSDWIIQKSDDGIPFVDLTICGDKSIRVFVKAYKTYSSGEYLYSERAFDLAKTIYSAKDPEKYYEDGNLQYQGAQEKRHLIFRCINMPHFYVFPDAVMDCRKKIGLFDHRKENV